MLLLALAASRDQSYQGLFKYALWFPHVPVSEALSDVTAVLPLIQSRLPRSYAYELRTVTHTTQQWVVAIDSVARGALVQQHYIFGTAVLNSPT